VVVVVAAPFSSFLRFLARCSLRHGSFFDDATLLAPYYWRTQKNRGV